MAIPIISGDVVDELDELVLPGATFFVAGAEWDFWVAKMRRAASRPNAGLCHRRASQLRRHKEKVKMV